MNAGHFGASLSEVQCYFATQTVHADLGWTIAEDSAANCSLLRFACLAEVDHRYYTHMHE